VLAGWNTPNVAVGVSLSVNVNISVVVAVEIMRALHVEDAMITVAVFAASAGFEEVAMVEGRPPGADADALRTKRNEQRASTVRSKILMLI